MDFPRRPLLQAITLGWKKSWPKPAKLASREHAEAEEGSGAIIYSFASSFEPQGVPSTSTSPRPTMVGGSTSSSNTGTGAVPRHQGAAPGRRVADAIGPEKRSAGGPFARGADPASELAPLGGP